MTVEKRPGWDWIVTYLAGDNDEPGELDVFGVMTIEEAVAEGHASLSAGELLGIQPNYIITGAIRADQHFGVSAA